MTRLLRDHGHLPRCFWRFAGRARSADDLVKGPFSFVFAGLSVLASIVVVVIALQMEDAERCAKRTVAGLLHHQTFTTFDVRP